MSASASLAVSGTRVSRDGGLRLLRRFARRVPRRRGRCRASRFGKMLTEPVRRRISRFSRSLGLVDQICCQGSSGKTVNADRVPEESAENACLTAQQYEHRGILSDRDRPGSVSFSTAGGNVKRILVCICAAMMAALSSSAAAAVSADPRPVIEVAPSPVASGGTVTLRVHASCVDGATLVFSIKGGGYSDQTDGYCSALVFTGRTQAPMVPGTYLVRATGSGVSAQGQLVVSTQSGGSVCDQAIAEAATGTGVFGQHELVFAPAQGGSGDQVIVGTEDDDRLSGGSGDDVVCGRGGDDILTGGSGHDALYGEEGADRLAGGAGDDFLDGGTGTDTLTGGSGDDVLTHGESTTAGSGDDLVAATGLSGGPTSFAADQSATTRPC